MKKTPLVLGAVAVAALTAGVGSANAADWLYYSTNMTVGRVQVDGSARNDSFATFTGMVTAVVGANGVAFAAVGSQPAQLYRLGDSGNTTSVGAPLCSTAPNSATTLTSPIVNNGHNLYYICQVSPSASARRFLARTDLDGGSRNESLVDLTGYYAGGALAVDANWAYFTTGSGSAPTRLDRVALTAGAIPEPGPQAVPMTMLINSAGFYWGYMGDVGTYASNFPTLTPTTLFTASGFNNTVFSLAGNATTFFWKQGGGSFAAIGKANADGSGRNGSFLTPTSPMNGFTNYLALVSSSSGGDTPTPAPTPAATPAATPGATPAATVLTAPTQSSTADSNGNVAVSLSLELDEVGKYTFIFEKVTSNEMSREQASGSSRISMQKGTKIGKRKLTKVITAADVTTTSAGAKLVMRALLKKAQAKNWNLRVIHAANDGTLTQSVIKK